MDMLNYCKAFDNLNHNLILYAARHCGYLSGRSPCVKYGGVFSSSAILTHGVLRGSELCYTIFNIFITGLLNSLPNNSSIAYADDVTLISQGDNAISASNNMLQMSLNILCSWLLDNKLSFNTARCFSMIISP